MSQGYVVFGYRNFVNSLIVYFLATGILVLLRKPKSDRKFHLLYLAGTVVPMGYLGWTFFGLGLALGGMSRRYYTFASLPAEPNLIWFILPVVLFWGMQLLIYYRLFKRKNEQAV